MSWLFPSGGQSIGDSASASVLPMNIRSWLPVGLTCRFYLLGVQESSPTPQFKSISSSLLSLLQSFPDSSVGKESTCNAGDPSSIPELGRSPGEGKGYSLQYSGLENSRHSPWGCKESDMTEQLSLLSLLHGSTLTSVHDY